MFSYAYSMKIVSMNPSRPLDARFFWGNIPSSFESYYRLIGKKKEHNNFLKVAREQNCRRASMLITPDYPEYPLVWRAMQEGIEMRHSFPPQIDDWPCMLFADGVKHRYVPDRGTRWINQGDTHTLVRNLAYDFERSSSVVLLLNHWKNTMGIQSRDQATTLEYDGSYLRVFAEDNDPYFILPEIKLADEQSSIIKISLDSSVETNFKLYYQTRKQENYSEEQVFNKKVEQGKNLVYFQLPGNEITGKIRIDPGAAPGEYTLNSIEIRKI